MLLIKLCFDVYLHKTICKAIENNRNYNWKKDKVYRQKYYESRLRKFILKICNNASRQYRYRWLLEFFLFYTYKYDTIPVNVLTVPKPPSGPTMSYLCIGPGPKVSGRRATLRGSRKGPNPPLGGWDTNTCTDTGWLPFLQQDSTCVIKQCQRLDLTL